MDVLASGPGDDPGPARPRGRLAALGREVRARLRRTPRAALAGAGVLVAVVVVLGLRAGAGPVVPAVPDPTPAVAVAPLPTGPFDREPGRTPIPEPSDSFGTLYGELPPTGAPGKASAVRAVQLVLGRYCLRPERYTISTDQQAGWFVVGAAVVGLDRGGDGPLIDLTLTWTGRAYNWTGSPRQLRVC